MPSLRPRFSPSTALAIIAIIAACSGSAVAAAKITGAQVVNGSITGADLKNGSIPRAKLARDARETSARLQVASAPATVVRQASRRGVGIVKVSCTAGEVALSGGGNAMGMWRNEPIVSDAGQATGWQVEGRLVEAYGEPGEGAWVDDDDPVATVEPTTTAYVVCARV